MTTANHNHPLLKEIEAYCTARGVKPCVFGKQAMGDPSFVPSLRRGRDLRTRTVDAIRHYMLTGEPRPRRPRKKQDAPQSSLD